MKIASRASKIPGSTERVMTRAATDRTGRRWPVGTWYQPQSSGYDNTLGAAVQVVRIAGQTVTF